MNDWRSLYNYDLPGELIAQHPPIHREEARMLVVQRETGRLFHETITALPRYLQPGDHAVLNNTKVIPARYVSPKGDQELVLIEEVDRLTWTCLVRPGKKFRPGHRFELPGAAGVVREILADGSRRVEFDAPPDPDAGRLALPHYIERSPGQEDQQRYQTVFASEPGAIAAPTAGLHFTPELLQAVPHSFVTLHVGPGTFQPVRCDRLEDHVMHEERFVVSPGAAAAINAARRRLAVGTTSVRVLESLAGPDGKIEAGTGRTRIFIHPPYNFQAVDLLLTNFHLPQTTLLLLVCAFAGRELALEAYREAVRERYRFFSYGDCMLII